MSTRYAGGPGDGPDPAPALSALHSATEASPDRSIGREALSEVAERLHMPLADLFDASSFYHYFGTGSHDAPRHAVCGGPTCALAGGQAVSDTGSGDTHTDLIPCPGLCDNPVARYDEGTFSTSLPSEGPFTLPGVAPNEEALLAGTRIPGRRTLDTYRAGGGYAQLERVARGDLGADEAMDMLQASGLAGRGGAAFPLAAKWRAVRGTSAPVKYVVCNADEGEPGTFKDRPILHMDPHLLIESMAIAGVLTGAETGIIYLRFEYPEALTILEKAIAEAESGGLLGGSLAGTDHAFRLYVRRGAGSYVCGEETALLNSLEGRRPWPRERPPFPTTSGLWGQPTIINNVETFCCVPGILEHGADRFQSLGRGDNAGTKIYSVSGRVRAPGNYELPLGVTAREVIEGFAGGAADGGDVKAFTLGGISGGILATQHLDVALDFTAPREFGVSLGSGGIVVLDDSSCVVDFVRVCMQFYQDESCGRCFPCRIGTVRMEELLEGLTGRRPLADDLLAEFDEIGQAMAVTSACGLGQAAPLIVQGMMRWFPDEFEEHRTGRQCRAGVCAF